ncbi:MAG: hypothetical protein WC775_03805 [Patescibacteria group bacterium]
MKILSKMLVMVFAVGVLFLIAPIDVYAGNLTNASMRLSRMTGSAVPTILVVVKPTTVGTETQFQINFNASFGVDTTPANITVSTASLPATYQGQTLTTWPGIGAAATAVNSNLVTFSSTDLTVGTLYGFYITAGITNPASANQYVSTFTTQATGPVTIDTKDVATRVITNDQVMLYATVSATFNFVLGANQDAFTTTLSTGSVVNTTGVTVTVNTNAGAGWIAWVRSANAGLASVSTAHTIATTGAINGSPDVLSTGAEGYVLDVTPTTDAGGGGTLTIAGEYDGNGTTSGGTLSTTLQEIATANGPANGDVLTLVARATISSLTQAASDYTDTYTVIGAGMF